MAESCYQDLKKKKDDGISQLREILPELKSIKEKLSSFYSDMRWNVCTEDKLEGDGSMFMMENEFESLLDIVYKIENTSFFDNLDDLVENTEKILGEKPLF